MKLIVDTNWSTGEVTIFLEEEVGSKIYLFGQKNGKIIRQEVDDDVFLNNKKKIYPLITLTRFMSLPFFQAMKNYLSEINIKTENENLMQGKLLATEKHLEDMRRISNVMLAFITGDPNDPNPTITKDAR